MIFIFVLILNCFCIVFMVFNFLIYFTRFCDHLSQKINGHLLMLLSIVFGKEARLRHVVVWLFANYSWSYSAARGPNVWKVSFCSLFFAWTLLFTVCQQSEHSVEKCDCRVCFVFFFGRFADLFGARTALSLACASTVVFFLLLATADTPAMLFIHKIPTVFMHVLPGEHQTYRFFYPLLTMWLNYFYIYSDLF